MPHSLTLSQFINAKIDVVFSFLDDEELVPKWNPAFVGIDWEGDRNVRNPVGVEFKQRMRQGSRVVSYDGEIIGYTKPRYFATKLTGDKVSIETHFKLATHAHGTQLTYTIQLSYPKNASGLAKFIDGLKLKYQAKKEVAALQKAAETSGW
jgi:hypothetical protein